MHAATSIDEVSSGMFKPPVQINFRKTSDSSTTTARSSIDSSQASILDASVAATQASSDAAFDCCSVSSGPAESIPVEIDPRRTDLHAFHMPLEGLCQAMVPGFTKVRKIAKGINGDIFEYRFQESGSIQAERMAVKKLKNQCLNNRDDTEADDRQIHFGMSEKAATPQEDALTEIGVLSYLATRPNMPGSLLRMHGVFADAKKPVTWLVTELADGELFDVAARGNVSEANCVHYIQQILEGISFIHLHRVAHRDISLENILLKDGNAKLMDFGAAVSSHSPFSDVELRFFQAVGKPSYRPPECYVPAAQYVTVSVPNKAMPGQITMVQTQGYVCEVKLPIDAGKPGSMCEAEVFGYAAPPIDVFAVGVCLFILLFQCPPWERALLVDRAFSFVLKTGLEELLSHWNKSLPSPLTMELLTALLQTRPGDRPSAQAALERIWLH